MLAVGDGIFAYDGPERRVLRWSPDLQSESVIAQKVICSPIAAWADRVYCAHVGGVSKVEGPSSPLLPIVQHQRAPIAAVAADSSRVVWLSDGGASSTKITVATIQSSEAR